VLEQHVARAARGHLQLVELGIASGCATPTINVCCRGRSPKTLDGLRRRIAGLFLAFCKNPAFNPEAGRLQLVPGGPAEPETFEYVDEVNVAA
jgi:hypothetical protein